MNETVLLEVARDYRSTRVYMVQITAYLLAGTFILFMSYISKQFSIFSMMGVILIVVPLIALAILYKKYLDDRPAIVITDRKIINRSNTFKTETEILWQDVYRVYIEEARTMVSRYVPEKFIMIELRNKKCEQIYSRVLDIECEELYAAMANELAMQRGLA